MSSKLLKDECDLSDQKIVDLITFPSNLFWDFGSTLTVLNLSHNLIEILPEKLFSLWNLQKLNLFNNKIKVIPDSISRLKKVNNNIWSTNGTFLMTLWDTHECVWGRGGGG